MNIKDFLVAEDKIYETKAVAEQTIIIPTSIEMPDIRIALSSGTLGPNYTIINTLKIFDADGKEIDIGKAGDVKIKLTEWPEENKEILGVLYLNFVISNKA